MTKLNRLHQPPDMWIKSKGEVTTTQVIHRFNLTPDDADAMLAALALANRVVRVVVDGEVRWRAPVAISRRA